MILLHTSTLPSKRRLKLLATWGGPYPIENRHLILAAERFGFGEKVINFLRLFPPDTVFQSRSDFTHHSNVILQFLRVKQDMPVGLAKPTPKTTGDRLL
jgi:hypothetical protein